MKYWKLLRVERGKRPDTFRVLPVKASLPAKSDIPGALPIGRTFTSLSLVTACHTPVYRAARKVDHIAHSRTVLTASTRNISINLALRYGHRVVHGYDVQCIASENISAYVSSGDRSSIIRHRTIGAVCAGSTSVNLTSGYSYPVIFHYGVITVAAILVLCLTTCYGHCVI